MDRKRLGRGLDALLGTGESDTPPIQTQVAIDQIQENPFQARKSFDPDELSALEESIKNVGLLQPLVVRQRGERFELIAGERRLRAAQAAGFTQVPVRIVDFSDQQTYEASLIENIQRTDLNPIEKAHGFKDYLERFQMTQEQLAARLGVDRTTISNLVNLLELAPEVQEAVRVGQISLGHAKVIKGLADKSQQVNLCKQIIAQGLSVRAAETLLKETRSPAEAAAPRNGHDKTAPRKTNHDQALEAELRQLLAARVEIRLRDKDKGEIVISFESNDDFERLLETLRKS